MTRRRLEPSVRRAARDVLVLAIAVGVLARPAAAQCPDGSPPPCARAAAAQAPTANSVGVMLFNNVTRDTASAYLAEGLATEIATSLARVPRLEVRSPGAVRSAMRGIEPDPRTVGRRLNVRYVVEGDFQRGGDRIRISVRLVALPSGTQRWSEAYTRPAADLLAVQEEIASAVATAIAGQLLPQERRVLAARATADPAAYDRLLRGNFLLDRRTGADARRAIAEYEAAVRLDPSLAQAWARIGVAYFLYLDWAWSWPGLTGDSMLARGFLASDRALALDSANSDAWLARGLLLRYRYPATLEGAVPALERAVQLDPRNADAWHHLGTLLVVMVDPAPARRALDRALALDPRRMITLANLGLLLGREGREAEALQIGDSAVATSPDAYYPRLIRGWTRLAQGDLAGARADADTALRLRPADFTMDTEAFVVAVLAAEGDSAAARARAEQLGRTLDDRAELPIWLPGYRAQAFVTSGQPDRAIAALERGRAQGVALWWTMQDPVFRPLRGDPRYQRLLAEVRPPWAR